MRRDTQSDLQDQQHFSTDNIALAAYLVVIGHRLTHLDGSLSVVIFCFESVGPEHVEPFYCGALLPAARFASAQRKLYALIRRRQEESGQLAREAATLSVAPIQPKHVKTVKPA